MHVRQFILPALILSAIIYSVVADTFLSQPVQLTTAQPPDFAWLSLVKIAAAMGQAVLMLWLARAALFDRPLPFGAHAVMMLVGLIVVLLCTIVVYRALPVAFMSQVVLDAWSRIVAAPVSLTLLTGAMLSAIGGAGLLYLRS